MVERKRLLKVFLCYLILIPCLVSCENGSSANETDQIETGTSIEHYWSNDSTESKAIQKIRKYLMKNEADVPVSEFFIDTVERKKDSIVVHINHYDYYVELDQSKKEAGRIKKLEEEGVSEIDLEYVPPTGNWSGRDRIMLYLPFRDSLIDLLYQ